MSEPTGYDIASYGEMIDCEPRMSVYAEALKRAITPGCTVIDIGASFGAFSILACKYGAGTVIAIEPDPSVELIMPMAQANGCADRIAVIRGLSTLYQPEAGADVIVSDIRGTMPLYENHIETIVDARERLLKPGGHQLPIGDTIRIAVVHSPEMYRTCEKPWVTNDYGLELSLGKSFAVNDYYRADLDMRALLSQPGDLASLDYRTITDPNLDSTTGLTVEKAGVAHGLLMWFDAEISEGLGFSNGPGEPQLVYGQKFLPFPEAINVEAGNRIIVRVRATHAGLSYVWSWKCDVVDGNTEETRQSFQQSTFKSRVHTAEELEPYSSLHVPSATTQMAVDRDCLTLVGEGRSVDDIAAALQERHPGRFESHVDAITHIGNMLKRYRDA